MHDLSEDLKNVFQQRYFSITQGTPLAVKLCTVVFSKYALPFATLALISTKCWGSLKVGCNIFSRDYALPSGDTSLLVGGEHKARGIAERRM